MNFFNVNIKKLIFFALIISLPLLSINMEQKTAAQTWFDQPLQFLASQVRGAFDDFSQGVRGTASLYLNLIGIKKYNQNLLDQNRELATRLISMKELQTENERLKSLLDFKQSQPMELVAAQVVGRDLLPDHNTLTINKGTDHGLKPGQAVITLEGALGYVFKPGPNSSRVMLITDRYAVVDGIVQRTRAHGIVEGRSSGSCSLKYVERTEDVKVGDLVVTGGLDNIFPKGLPVARVDDVERKTFSVSLKVDLRPVVDADKVEHVFVVTNAKGADLNPPEPLAPSATPTALAPKPSGP